MSNTFRHSLPGFYHKKLQENSVFSEFWLMNVVVKGRDGFCLVHKQRTDEKIPYMVILLVISFCEKS